MTTDYKQVFADVSAACLLSGVHGVLIGGPGWGKTEVLQQLLALVMNGNGHGKKIIVLDFKASTAPEEVSGALDIPEYTKTGGWVINYTGTAYDPDAFCVLADEIGRANDAAADALLHAMTRKDLAPNDQPVFLGTTNFALENKRAEAANDRVAAWLPTDFLTDSQDIDSIVDAQTKEIGQRVNVSHIKMPTFDDCMAARAAVFSQDAINACAKMVKTLAAEIKGRAAAGTGLVSGNRSGGDNNLARIISPRRTKQWLTVLLRYSYWLYGNKSDFASPHPKAVEVLAFCWPHLTPDAPSYPFMRDIVSQMADIIGLRLQAVLQMAGESFTRVTKDQGTTLADRALVLTTELQKQLGIVRDLRNELGNDPRFNQTVTDIQTAFERVLHGNDPF